MGIYYTKLTPLINQDLESGMPSSSGYPALVSR
jgi:hypothetical protein